MGRQADAIYIVMLKVTLLMVLNIAFTVKYKTVAIETSLILKDTFKITNSKSKLIQTIITGFDWI